MSGSAYKLFGLKPGASEEEIRKRYRILVKKYHPDVNKRSDAQQKFIALQEAYETLLNGTGMEVDQPVDRKSDFETQYTAYRNHAREKYEERKRKEEAELNALYHRLSSGYTIKLHRMIAYTGIAIILVLCLDMLLPTHVEPNIIVAYSTEPYQSMNGDFVCLASTKSGDQLFLNAFSNHFFDTNPFVQLEKTAILHQPIQLLSQSRECTQKVPIHFNFYWAQFVLYPFFIIPFVFLRYRKKDAFFIMGSYFSRFASGILMLYFLMTEDRWLHLLTLGFY